MSISRRHFLQAGAALAGALPLSCATLPEAPRVTRTDRKPNIVLIFTDDQGYQDLGCYGSPLIKTPHLDRMAKEGMRFTDFYSASAICSPSRAALMTGCYPPRVSITKVLWPHTKVGLHASERTIADLLQEEGYATACIGKWHLGHQPEHLPTAHGFDSYYGIPYSNDMKVDPEMSLAADVRFREGMTKERMRTEEPRKNWVPLMRDEKVIEYPADQATLTQRYTREAVNFIKEHHNKPFFLYLPHTMPHIPLAASEGFAGKSERGLYGDVIEEIDWSTGEILRALKEQGLDENTLVIFTSDNGPWKLDGGRGGNADPLRGYKFSTLEGGMRVPCLMRWPGVIPPGSTCSEVAGTIDMLPTLAALAGAQPPQDRVIDGKDIRALMAGLNYVQSPHTAYYYCRNETVEAMRQGRWKLRITEKEGIQLYNLADDPGEARNLAGEDTAFTAHLMQRMKAFEETLQKEKRPAGVLP